VAPVGRLLLYELNGRLGVHPLDRRNGLSLDVSFEEGAFEDLVFALLEEGSGLVVRLVPALERLLLNNGELLLLRTLRLFGGEVVLHLPLQRGLSHLHVRYFRQFVGLLVLASRVVVRELLRRVLHHEVLHRELL